MAIDSSGWLDETKAKLRRGNKVLFDLKNPLFSDLANVISHESPGVRLDSRRDPGGAIPGRAAPEGRAGQGAGLGCW